MASINSLDLDEKPLELLIARCLWKIINSLEGSNRLTDVIEWQSDVSSCFNFNLLS